MSNYTVLNAWRKGTFPNSHTISEQTKSNGCTKCYRVVWEDGGKRPRCERQALAWYFFSCCSQVRKVSWEDKGGRQIKQKVRSVQVQRTPSIWIKNLLCTFVKKKKERKIHTFEHRISTKSVSREIYLRCIYTFLHICVAMTIDCSYRGMQPCQHVSVYLHINRCKLLYLCVLFFCSIWKMAQRSKWYAANIMYTELQADSRVCSFVILLKDCVQIGYAGCLYSLGKH